MRNGLSVTHCSLVGNTVLDGCSANGRSNSPLTLSVSTGCHNSPLTLSVSTGCHNSPPSLSVSTGCHNSPPTLWVSISVDDLAKRQPSGRCNVVHQ
ncbi:hypothetical protein ElyMa_003700900 [Elysia marginata]|uniref:Uncharacterized protein n=1 Tax=Elysia marginata TaxID=1093978 RepID=A0AAV4F1K8_9GAST|nr:hypothetical protein ElyMa_003700900 [Elysia marginata]